MSGDHSAAAIDTTDPTRYRASRRVTWVSVLTNVVLSAAQIVIGVVGHSQALVADGVHTLSDLVTDGLVLVALEHSSKEADEEHPYGHGRIETAVTMILGGMLLAVGIGIAWQAGMRLWEAESFVSPSALTLWVAIFTLAAKEGLYRYTIATANRYGSAMLKANAWHHRSDAISSFIVVAGIAGSLLGFGYLDGVAAVLVAGMIAKIGTELAWHALRELIDTGLDPEEREAIRRTIANVCGVKALHSLRTRRIAGQALVDVHIMVDSRLSVSEGHQIGEAVRARLIKEIAPVTDVMVHIDTEEDLDDEHRTSLPLRDEVLARLEAYFRAIPEARHIDRITLHYTNGHVDIEIRLPLGLLAETADADDLRSRFRAAARPDLHIGSVELVFH